MPDYFLYYLLCRALPKTCQKVLFSATYADEVRQFAQSVVPEAIMMTLKRSEETLDNIKQVRTAALLSLFCGVCY